MDRKEKKTELQLTLEGIHALYIDGKISLERHNLWCEQACAGATSFEL